MLAHLVHLALNHHDVLFGGGDHKVKVASCHLGEPGIDDKLAVDTCHADLGYGTAERQVAGSKGRRCGQAGKSVGLSVLIGRDKAHIYEYFQVEILGPQRAQGPVDKACDQNLVVRRFAFPLEEAAGKASCGIILLSVIHCEGHEIGALFNFFCSANCGEQHGAAHFYDCGTVGLLGKLAGFDFDHAAVRELDFFVDNVHYCFLYVFLLCGFSGVPLLICLKKGWLPLWEPPKLFLLIYRRRPSFLTISLYLSMSTFWR